MTRKQFAVAMLVWLIAFLAYTWMVHRHGADSVQAKWDLANAQQAAAAAKDQAQKAEATTKVVTKYVDRVRVVRETGETIIKEVPIYVQKTDPNPAVCALERDAWRVLHDAAAQNKPANSAAGDPDAPGPSAQDTAATVVSNYTQYHQVAEQLHALQEWVRSQQINTRSK